MHHNQSYTAQSDRKVVQWKKEICHEGGGLSKSKAALLLYTATQSCSYKRLSTLINFTPCEMLNVLSIVILQRMYMYIMQV